MTNGANVVIVGAGVTGLSTAYHLAKKRAGRIVVVEKGPVGNGSSLRAGGIITGLMWDEEGVLVRKRCLELYPLLSEDLEGYRFQQVGCLNLFTADSRQTWQEREALLPLYDRLGAPYEILEPEEIARRWHALRPHPGVRALFDPLGGYSEPSEYIPALRRKVEAMGVEVREFEPVTGFHMRGDRLAGVRTNSQLLEADAIVCTVYSWTRVLLGRIDVELPVKCFVHQCYMTSPLPEKVPIPAVNAHPYSCYFRPALGGRLLVGLSTPEREEYHVPSIDFEFSEITVATGELQRQLVQNLTPLLPVLGQTSWEDEKVGLLTYSMDGGPILGPVARMPGLYVGLAFHSGVFAYNPGTGELLAEHVTDGRTSIDVRTWSPNRFDEADTKRYLATTLRQKEVGTRRH